MIADYECYDRYLSMNALSISNTLTRINICEDRLKASKVSWTDETLASEDSG